MANNKVSKKNIFYSVLHNFVGEGLITNNGTDFFDFKNFITYLLLYYLEFAIFRLCLEEES